MGKGYGANLMTKEVVIARYKEDVSWLDDIPRNIKKTIYHKDLEENSPWNGSYDAEENEFVIALPNIGNEAHTYLWHIVNRYDSLADITFFLQGNPFDHSSGVLERVNSAEYWQFDGFLNLCDFVTTSGPWGEPHHPDNPIEVAWYWNMIFGGGIGGKVDRFPGTITFGAGAQFAVTRERIKKRPKEFYEYLLNFCDITKEHRTEKNELRFPMIMERLWHKVFE